MNTFEYELNKQRQLELLQAAEQSRLVTEGTDGTAQTTHPAIVWLGHRLIELGEKLAPASVNDERDVMLAS